MRPLLQKGERVTASDAYCLLNPVDAYAKGRISWSCFIEILNEWMRGKTMFDYGQSLPERILGWLEVKPGLTSKELAKACDAGLNATQVSLGRLRAKHLVKSSGGVPYKWHVVNA